MQTNTAPLLRLHYTGRATRMNIYLMCYRASCNSASRRWWLVETKWLPSRATRNKTLGIKLVLVSVSKQPKLGLTHELVFYSTWRINVLIGCLTEIHVFFHINMYAQLMRNITGPRAVYLLRIATPPSITEVLELLKQRSRRKLLESTWKQSRWKLNGTGSETVRAVSATYRSWWPIAEGIASRRHILWFLAHVTRHVTCRVRWDTSRWVPGTRGHVACAEATRSDSACPASG